jgi:hypothetical protein
MMMGRPANDRKRSIAPNPPHQATVSLIGQPVHPDGNEGRPALRKPAAFAGCQSGGSGEAELDRCLESRLIPGQGKRLCRWPQARQGARQAVVEPSARPWHTPCISGRSVVVG